jgi:N,N'-diacetyllegionaminate synthase
VSLVIAEVGENHCGDWQKARDLIRVAADVGADYVKFQLYDANATAKDDPEREWFHRVQMSDVIWRELAAYARGLGVEPLCTPWGVEKARAVHAVTPKAVKIASFHITDEPVLRFVNGSFERVFLSTGMADLREVERAVSLLDKVKDLFLLHCVSEYPLLPERANLRVMETLRARFGSRVKIGYSDHVVGIEAAVASAAMGADVVEKHITMDKRLEGTDHVFSADPPDLAEMVRRIRQMETLRGEPEKKLSSEEAKVQNFMRNRFSHLESPTKEG